MQKLANVDQGCFGYPFTAVSQVDAGNFQVDMQNTAKPLLTNAEIDLFNNDICGINAFASSGMFWRLRG